MAHKIALGLSSPPIKAVASLAAEHHVAICTSFPERYDTKTGEVTYYNTVVCFDRGGALRGLYRKVHLWAQESESFAPGPRDQPLQCFDLALGASETKTRIGLWICFDIDPSFLRSKKAAGMLKTCDIILVPLAETVVKWMTTSFNRMCKISGRRTLVAFSNYDEPPFCGGSFIKTTS